MEKGIIGILWKVSFCLQGRCGWQPLGHVVHKDKNYNWPQVWLLVYTSCKASLIGLSAQAAAAEFHCNTTSCWEIMCKQWNWPCHEPSWSEFVRGSGMPNSINNSIHKIHRNCYSWGARALKALWQKKWTNFAKLAWHFPGSHHLSLIFLWKLKACVAMVKKLVTAIFTIDSHRMRQLEDHGWSHWTDLPINYSLGTNSTVKPFKPLGVAKSTIYKVLQNLENWSNREKQLASGRPAVNLTKGKRKQLVNAQLDKKCQQIGSSSDLCSKSIWMRRAEVTWLQKRFHQSSL